MKHKIIITLLLVASSIADQKSSLYVFHHGYHELNPIYGIHPSDGRFIGEHTGIDALQIVALWKTKGKLHKVITILTVGNVTNNSIATIHNYNLPERKNR